MTVLESLPVIVLPGNQERLYREESFVDRRRLPNCAARLVARALVMAQ